MAHRKSNNSNLRRTYGLFVEIGLIAALLVVILAFRLDLQAPREIDFTLDPPDMIAVEDIPPTEHVQKPPPPPRPPVPVEVPNDTILEEEPLRLDNPFEIDEPLATLPPPPLPPEDREKEEKDDEPFVVVEDMPELIGGIGEVQKQITYPEMARKAGVEGRVTIQFVVDESGNVTAPVVLRGIGAGCDEEALRVVRQAKFKPGKQRGNAVKVKMSLPITFKLK